MLSKFNVDVKGILLNKVYNESIFENVVPYIKNNSNVDEVLSVGKLKLETRGFTPEIEIRYDLFTKAALDLVEESLDIDKIAKMAQEVKFNRIIPFEEIKDKVI